ncbi:MAG TPA: hypothetical protein VLJ57_01155 [Burkholderiaceae bacterium]|nr:hypothetical protein [Burkholderiaceae bacterium]
MLGAVTQDLGQAPLPLEKPMKQQRFWEVDLRILLLELWNELSAFGMTLVVFLLLGLPVIIPTLILWFLSSINFSMR